MHFMKTSHRWRVEKIWIFFFVRDGIYNSVADYNSTWWVSSVCLLRWGKAEENTPTLSRTPIFCSSPCTDLGKLIQKLLGRLKHSQYRDWREKVSHSFKMRLYLYKRKEPSPEIYDLFSPSDSSHPLPLLEWYLTHPSPQGPPLRASKRQKMPPR